MAHEMLVGLKVTDDAAYARYRAAITPILHRFGGGFRYDFKVAEVVHTAAQAPINRVFTIRFADRASKDAFFEGAVAATTILAEYAT
jgi:uncharacterized protein (DUF1330 family)